MWRKPGIWLALLGAILIAIGGTRRIENPKNIPQKAQEIIKNAETEVAQLNELLVNNENRLYGNSSDDFIAFCDSIGLVGLRFNNGIPQVWNSQDFQLNVRRENTFELVEQNGIYLGVWHRYNDSISLIFAHNLFDLSFPEITSSESYNPPLDLFLGSVPVENSLPLNLKGSWINPSPLFLILFNYETNRLPDFFFLLGWIFLSLGIYLWGIEQSNRIWAWMNVAFWLLFLILEKSEIIITSLHKWRIFSEDVFYFNSYLHNLASTLIWFFLILWVLRFLLNVLERKFADFANISRFLLQALLWIGVAGLTLFAFQFTGYLIEKTDIHFRFTELSLISGTTILAVGLIALIFAAVITIIHFIQRQIEKQPISNEMWIYWFFTALTISIATKLCDLNTWFFAATFLGFILLRIHLKLSKYQVFRWISEILIPCLLVSIWVNNELKTEELAQREFFATSLMVEPDSDVKVQLTDAETGLNKDLPIFVSLGLQENKTEEFESTIQQQYFGSLLENFDVSIFGYNPDGECISSNKSADFGSLNALYFSDGGVQVTKQFYLVNERRLSGSYIGKFGVFNDTALKATYFILVSPSSARSKGRLTDVLNNSPSREILNRNRYSYAVYNGKTLSKHFGDYNYPLTLNWPISADPNMHFSEPDYHHIIREDFYGNLIVVSRAKASWVVGSIQFTLFIFGGIFFTILFYSWIWLEERLKIKVNPRHWQRQLTKGANMLFSERFLRESWFISRRLQVYIIWLLLSIFGIVLYTTINYFTLNNAERQQEELLSKVNQIANRISGQSDLDALVNQYEVGLIYDMAESYQTDINIYDAFGQLIVSTNPRLFKEQYRSMYMNPEAYLKFKKASSSTFVLNEQISELKYISAYSIINDNSLNVRGFVNLPYYSNRVDLYRQISSYMVTVVNVFVILFAIVYIITQIISTRITQPLLLIRDEISRMKLGVRNEHIPWNRNDEVGLLVSEYNKMIDALDVSLNKLSEVERQGAWREMAKQVAHEIKNPLTPMRLSLQHLEYAMSRKDENIQEKTKKTIQLLIRQIDSLSSMAEEFSSFAKMPEPKMQITNFVEVLQDAVALMEREMGYTIQCNIPIDILEMQADPHQLGRVFNNLFKNAIQAIPDDRQAQVRVSVEVSQATFTVTVTDNGKGIPKDLYDKIFSPNFSTKNSGMGLGLAISKKIVEQFGGKIDFDSQENIGTTFTLVFPKL